MASVGQNLTLPKPTTFELKIIQNLLFNYCDGVDLEVFLSRLDIYFSILLDYGDKINLISKKTYQTIIDRHVIDSLQLTKFISKANCNILDLGSGSGFPGIILLLASFTNRIILTEKSPLKRDFLHQVVAAINGSKEDALEFDGAVNCNNEKPLSSLNDNNVCSNVVINSYLFGVKPSNTGSFILPFIAADNIFAKNACDADYVVARAFKSLKILCDIVDCINKFNTKDHKLLTLKGLKYQEELTEAHGFFNFQYHIHSSQTSGGDGVVLELWNIVAK